YTPKHLADRILMSRAALEGERKQVTVLFADLKGSMELLADRDPEEARKILDPVLEHMMEAVHRYEGTVNQVMGDGIMALFGAGPHEVRRANRRDGAARPGARGCQGRPWSSRRRGGRARRRQVSPLLRVRPVAPGPGLSRHREPLGVVRQGDGLSPGHRAPAQL